jgi:hypothetical protein
MIDAAAYIAVARSLDRLGSVLSEPEAETLRDAADALALSDPVAVERLERAEGLLARLEARGRLAGETIESLHVALRGISDRVPLPG